MIYFRQQHLERDISKKHKENKKCSTSVFCLLFDLGFMCIVTWVFGLLFVFKSAAQPARCWDRKGFGLAPSQGDRYLRSLGCSNSFSVHYFPTDGH